ncbi:methionyl-tRNA formyltransferase [Treponema ruminis]|uniref:Methionyl-tRNA formyltransferase n=1 Tax=Treponema ruminis TaxID=744515 RepID=A0A7W8GAE7_9SPIR|nr:methionyl-tRNA formyltransferase [Treponema ruminis]MBB5226828.1 methionyl-tRNA formyltransferase [Treponema ruminis]QSI01259.1 methionyl-tRNA formyltransferase [Treponema ruminis]
MRKLKIIYAGSPLASSIVLKGLIASQSECGFEIAGVLTNPPSTRGRHSDLIPTEVALAARENNIPVFEFDHLVAQAREAVSPLEADLLVSFDYGRIFGPKFLALFPLGGINLHPSLLPKYRGCTPVPAALLNGDKTLGVTVQKLALQTDEGDILAQSEIKLDGSETTLSLMDGDGSSSRVTEAGLKLLKKVLKEAANSDSELIGKKQSGETSYTPFLKKEDGIIDWNKSAAQIDCQIRAYTPYPLCFTDFNGVKVTILKARPSDSKTSEKPGTVLPYQKSVGIEIACGDGSVLVVTELQQEKKKAMDYKSFLNGARNFVGSILGLDTRKTD